MKTIWLSSPHMGGEELDYVNLAFNENWVAPLGPNVDGFETDLQDYLQNNSKVSALSSGTAAIHLALISCNVQPGDEVICQSLTFVASANPIMYLGATPVFVDSELDTWNMCPIYLEKAIQDRIALGKKPKAIIAVHLYGMPYKHKEINEIAQKYQIPVIEDAAEALGSEYDGKKCGTLGDFGVLSFNGNKIITTSGGGALICKTSSQKEVIYHLSTQAKDNKPFYEHSSVGYNYRMSNIVAGIGRGQMKVLNQRVNARRENHNFYKNIFQNVPGVKLFDAETANVFSNHWLSAILVNSSEADFTIDEFMTVFEEHNIQCRHVWKPMHLQPIFAKMPYYGGTNAEFLFTNGICLPSGSSLSTEEKEYIKATISKILELKMVSSSI